MRSSLAPLSGIHHVTALASEPQRNLDFYTRTLGQRLVKKTVNFDDPGAYHFYFADYAGSPGTLLTFFPWPRARRGVRGSGEIWATAYHTPASSLDDWEARLRSAGVSLQPRVERFGEVVLPFADPDGMIIELVGASAPPPIQPWNGGPVAPAMELSGFHSVTLQVRDAPASIALLHDLFGWTMAGKEGKRTRLVAPGAALGRIVDLVEEPGLPSGSMGYGTVHHVAFRVPDDEAQEQWRALLAGEGFGVTPMRDRQYFHSIYFREPNGVLFEIATDPPGMMWDEPLETLGAALKLPPWFEPQRAQIERNLPPVS